MRTWNAIRLTVSQFMLQVRRYSRTWESSSPVQGIQETGK